MKFHLPADITFAKESIDDQWVYTFRHKDLGDIGRIRLKGVGGNTMINIDIIGDPADPMTARRREIFEPIGIDIANRMENAVGSCDEKPVPTPVPATDQTLVKNQVIPCETCGEYVAMLIFADNAGTPDRLEDYARMMYPNYSKMRVPTWVIGSVLRDSADAPALILKVWPERLPATMMLPAQFNPVIDELATSHCG